jgi:hypothetical protein
MAIYPEIIAGYGASLKAVEGLDVTIHEPGVPNLSDDPIEMLQGGPAAYSILLVVLPEGVNVCRHGQFGFLTKTTMVDYPVSHQDGAFEDRLRAVLRPVVKAELATAATEKAAAVAEHGPNPLAWGAIQWIG